MVNKPIIPIWLMTIICVGLSILIIYNKPLKDKISNKKDSMQTPRQKKLKMQYFINVSIKILIIILLFIINLRLMIPNGEAMAMNPDLNILFVIDTSVSMRALDYNGNKERLEGVVNDCCKIVDQLSGCRFCIITFGDTAQKMIPFTTDSDIVQAELKAIKIEDDFYAKGSSMNLSKDIMIKTLKEEQQKKEGTSKTVVFFVSDGEITKANERLETFSSIGQYISNGAVMGYGTTKGGKMVNEAYKDEPSSELYYKHYYDNESNYITAISKIDEKNLKQIAQDLKIDYIQMDKSANIDYKIKEVQQQILNSKSNEEKVNIYTDIYYYFAIPLVILLIIDFIIKKRRM